MSAYDDIDIAILKRHITDSYNLYRQNLTEAQINDLVKEVLDQIDNLYPDYGKHTLPELADILKVELSQYIAKYINYTNLLNNFDQSCSLKEQRIIEYPIKYS